MTIWKYEVHVSDTVIVWMPSEAKLLQVGSQHGGKIALWVAVDPSKEIQKYYFYIRGTGDPLGDAKVDHHVGTVLDGRYVWHVFEA